MIKQVKLKTTGVPNDLMERDISIYWGLSQGIRGNVLPRERVERQISFVLANSKASSIKLQQKFLELRELNRKRTDA